MRKSRDDANVRLLFPIRLERLSARAAPRAHPLGSSSKTSIFRRNGAAPAVAWSFFTNEGAGAGAQQLNTPKLLDYAFIDKFLPLYVEGAILTIRVGVAGILLALAVGLFCAVVKSLRVPGLTWLVSAYGELSRNTPLLVQLFFLYFGLPKIGIRLSGEWCAIIGLAFLGGSYMAEALRSGLEAVPKIQSESARVLGLSVWQSMRFVILPQALAVALPALVANVIFLVKEVSVVSAIALPDLMYVAKDLIGNYYRTDESLLLLVAAYVVLLLPVSLLGTYLEKRLRHAGFGNLRSL